MVNDNIKINKSGQFKIQQMAFMLMGVVLFFILVGVFWLALKSSSLKKSAAGFEQEQAIALALSLADSPELACSEGGQCIDFYKAMVLKNTRITEGLWPISSIDIRRVYPRTGNLGQPVECTVGNYPNCDIISIKNSNPKNGNAASSSFVKLCRLEKNYEGYVYQKCELGEIIVRI